MTILLNNQIDVIKDCHKELESYFADILKVTPSLTRKIISYQGNKNEPFYRWCKYKEAFSASLVEYLLYKYNIPKGIVFDPFAGYGTTLIEALRLNRIGIANDRVKAFCNLMESNIQILKNNPDFFINQVALCREKATKSI